MDHEGLETTNGRERTNPIRVSSWFLFLRVHWRLESVLDRSNLDVFIIGGFFSPAWNHRQVTADLEERNRYGLYTAIGLLCGRVV
jgi:hypothetical protein